VTQRETNTQLVGLIGWPVEHSVSPAMFNAAFDALGMNWRYDLFAAPQDKLPRVVTALHEHGVRGFNVTVPHKRSVMELLDVVKPEARIIGAVNTVTALTEANRRWEGTNTDGIGFSTDLRSRIPEHPRGASAIILGAGGAARAAAYILAQMGYQIYIAAREPVRGLEIIRDVQAGITVSETHNRPQGSTQWRMQMRTVPWNRLEQIGTAVRLIVNCTPVGMWPRSDASPWPDDVPLPSEAVVYDMVYRPIETTFMRQARAAGLEAHNGLGMLVQQGIIAFQLWTGQDAPVEVMYTAAQRALAHDTK
jgi:shikimate dehydrogenase